MSSAPEFLICLNCESPCYVFEWKEGEISEIICETCGADDPEQFASEDDLEALADQP